MLKYTPSPAYFTVFDGGGSKLGQGVDNKSCYPYVLVFFGNSPVSRKQECGQELAN